MPESTAQPQAQPSPRTEPTPITADATATPGELLARAQADYANAHPADPDGGDQ
ncbi:hypothetical protein EDD90_3281 [Streptomyces sp. Ag109_O5-1]|uniref:hypothetical protein n=1 Tax=Streptomyces sp. Ag109_O5-1 TaxID=1938851 RepID=UPI000F9B917F|nr:hypothetical protein [Streptomyces sp. Ag109_O5-1]RPE40245.1 hypothetical protein EDD90_3281 [Streptomyces sp. Ag109_O5-1]